MPKCIYCLQEKPSGEFNREHVIPQAFGKFQNNLTLTECVCWECNDFFGKELDLPFGRESFEGLQRGEFGLKKAEKLVADFIGNRLTMRWGDGSEYNGLFLQPRAENGELTFGIAPQVGFAKEKGHGWNFMTEDDLDRMKNRPEGVDFRREKLFIPARDADRLIRLLKHKGIPCNEKAKRDASPINPDGRIRVEGSYIFDRIVARAVCKVAFNYMANIAGGRFALHEDFNEIRGFIRWGTHTSFHYLNAIQNRLQYQETGTKRQTPGHLIALEWREWQAEIIVCFSLFHLMTYEIILSPKFSGVWENYNRGHHFDVSRMRVERFHPGKINWPISRQITL